MMICTYIHRRHSPSQLMAHFQIELTFIRADNAIEDFITIFIDIIFFVNMFRYQCFRFRLNKEKNQQQQQQA